MKSKIKGLYQRGKIYWFKHQRGGRRFYVSLDTQDYAQAVAKAARILAQPELNPTQGLQADIDAFTAEQVRMGNWTRSSLDSKGRVLNLFAKWADYRRLTSLGPEDLQRYYEHERDRLSPSSAQSYLMTLRSFFNWAVAKKLIRDNPVAQVRMGRLISSPRRLFCDFAQRDRLIGTAPTPELGFILYCGFHAGLRKNEIVQARPDWFDLASGVLHVKKTGTFMPKDKEERTVPLSQAFKTFLGGYGLRAPFMLRPDVVQGKDLHRYDFDKPFRRHTAAQGLAWVTAHVMRHTFGSLLASSGCSIYKIAIWMGDEVRTAQKHYAHLLPVDADIELLERRG